MSLIISLVVLFILKIRFFPGKSIANITPILLAWVPNRSSFHISNEKILSRFISIWCFLRHSFEKRNYFALLKGFIAFSSVVARNYLKYDMVAIVSNTLYRMKGNDLNSFLFYRGTVKLVSHIHISICEFICVYKFSFLHYGIRNK